MFQQADTLQPGATYPLGAHWDGQGVNFALVAPNAHAVLLCLFDDSGKNEERRLRLPACENGIWHGYLPEAAPGLVYAYRVFGTYAPNQGHRYNPNKVLLDPYARQVVGQYLGQDEFRCDNPADTAAIALKGRVTHEPYDWSDDARPKIAQSETVIYELHVKGFTKLNSLVPEALRGSYAALAHPAVLDYLQQLGVTTLNLLPVHSRADEARLHKMGLSNYWGYSSIGYFAPEERYWSGRAGTTPISEFRDMVKALHGRGLEVVLDVVYNHTAESDEVNGPTLSFRGIDNSLYYRLRPDNKALGDDMTGCGNSLNLAEPRVLQLVMDSLRYWVEEMHVDGFRFDLATVLARDARGFSPTAPFFSAIGQDPLLSRVKLIAEPWDLGAGGYQLGQFPAGWLEWNDRYRDTMRAFWLHQWPMLGDFAQRFAGSSDYFRHHNRNPASSINFIAVHDGFTLEDLVSYNHKHNEANGEDNRDGNHHNHSWNCGVEGATTAPEVRQLRGQLKRALLATLLFSQGTPMLQAGDETGHSQRGNNNAYCQDSPLTWIDWHSADQELIAYVRRLIVLRRRYPVLRHVQWFTGEGLPFGYADIVWLSSGGEPVQGAVWHTKGQVCLGILLRGSETETTCLLLVNASAEPVHFKLPPGSWRVLLDSANPMAPLPKISEETVLSARTVWLAVPFEWDQQEIWG
ncbi:MAG: glycogen debranching protein GlgX [Burkholderiaceae bacterium]|nr:glycogen debranching protein GlgX [Burkholderiaceae bacterium]